MKVIFLDIDGVMNSHVFFEQRHKKLNNRLRRIYYRFKSKVKWVFNGFKHKYKSSSNWEHPEKMYTFDYQFKRLKESTCSQKWKWLSDFCNENDIKICISSVWKNHFGNKEYNLPNQWREALVKLGFKEDAFVGITGDRRTLRGEEIKEWLEKDLFNIEDYAILDDDADMLPDQFKKFHHCDGWFGLSPNHLYRINRQFEGVNTYENLVETPTNVSSKNIEN